MQFCVNILRIVCIIKSEISSMSNMNACNSRISDMIEIFFYETDDDSLKFILTLYEDRSWTTHWKYRNINFIFHTGIISNSMEMCQILQKCLKCYRNGSNTCRKNSFPSNRNCNVRNWRTKIRISCCTVTNGCTTKHENHTQWPCMTSRRQCDTENRKIEEKEQFQTIIICAHLSSVSLHSDIKC